MIFWHTLVLWCHHLLMSQWRYSKTHKLIRWILTQKMIKHGTSRVDASNSTVFQGLIEMSIRHIHQPARYQYLHSPSQYVWIIQNHPLPIPKPPQKRERSPKPPQPSYHHQAPSAKTLAPSIPVHKSTAHHRSPRQRSRDNPLGRSREGTSCCRSEESRSTWKRVMGWDQRTWRTYWYKPISTNIFKPIWNPLIIPRFWKNVRLPILKPILNPY